jgi:hypothetical protein
MSVKALKRLGWAANRLSQIVSVTQMWFNVPMMEPKNRHGLWPILRL